MQCALLALRNAGKELYDPGLMLRGHLSKETPALLRQLDQVGTPIGRVFRPDDQSAALQLVDDSRYVAAGYQHAAGELAHLQAMRRALELGHEIETRQRCFEFLGQGLAHMRLHEMRTGQQAQPQPQRLVMIIGQAAVHSHGSAHSNSPPATTMLCPVTDSLPGRHSHATALATSSG